MEIKKYKEKTCELCGELAKSLCLKCNSYFCDSCYKFVHEKKKNNNHQKVDIDPFVPFDTKCPEHPNVPVNLFCIDDKGKLFIYNFLFHIELICVYCYFLKSHNSHKILLIDDEESLKKENINFDESTKEFDTKFEKINNLKEKIEQEIININKSYDTTFNDITKSFEEKHAKLYKEENDLIEKLQNEVTKIKEKLENFLSECNDLIRFNEKIDKGVKKMENNKENNKIKIMSYISEINKNQKSMNILDNQLMKNMNIKFEEENTKIKFEDYYFNGIPSPNNIEIKKINTRGFEVNWKFEYNYSNLDKNKIKYMLEIRKENENFYQIYEGDKTNYIVEKLSPNTNYEIKICAKYNDINGIWSDIYKVKTNLKDIDFDNNSLIIENNKEYENTLKNWINPDKKIKAELLYRLTRDGDLYKTFHEKCDNKGPTLTLIHDTSNIKTGGYTPLSWDSNTKWKRDNETFIFNLTNKKKFAKPNNNNTDSIYC